jgi:hypothetical protein
MKLKTLVIVVAILAVLSIATYYLQRPPAQTGIDPRVGKPVFDTKVLSKTSEIRLTEEGKTVVLDRLPDGKWIVPSYYGIDADFSKLSSFIDDLTSAKIQRMVTDDPKILPRLEFKDTSITLLDSAKHTLWALTLGKDAEGGGRFIRFDDEKKGYLANLTAYIDSASKNWINTALLTLKPEDIAGVELTFDQGAPLVASRASKDAAWTAEQTPAGQRIKSDRVTSLLTSFTGLRFEDTAALTAPKVLAARQHSRTVTLTTFAHQVITIEIGREPAPKKPAEANKPETKDKNAAAAFEKPEEPKTPAPPAGPVYVFVTSSDPAAPINLLMKKCAFQTFAWNFTDLPKERDELFEPVPAAPAAAKTPAPAKAPAKTEAPSPAKKP